MTMPLPLLSPFLHPSPAFVSFDQVGFQTHPHFKKITRTNLSLLIATRQGLIRARLHGGNAATGTYLAFIDAHVRVAPDWLSTPLRLLQERSQRLVNFVNVALDPLTFEPLSGWQGMGTTATLSISLAQSWGGASAANQIVHSSHSSQLHSTQAPLLPDLSSPITLGMFATSKAWWNQGGMDPGLQVWGGENVEISLRTWLCGGDIVVAMDSFVAHTFRKKFPYKISMEKVLRNYARVAAVWMDGKYRSSFYHENGIRLRKSGGLPFDIGNITGIHERAVN